MEDGNSSNFKMIHMLKHIKYIFNIIYFEIKYREDDFAIVYKYITKFDIINHFHS